MDGDDQMSRVKWTSRDNSLSFRQGWIVCYTARNGKFRNEIMRYDEDEQDRFECDDEAIEYVLRHANRSKTCRKAVHLVYGI